MSAFSDRLRMLRKSRKVSQTRLAKVLGYGYTAIANYESGRNEPSLGDLRRIADFFDVSTDYLLGRTDDQYSHKNFELYKRLKDVTFFDFLGAAEYAAGLKNNGKPRFQIDLKNTQERI